MAQRIAANFSWLFLENIILMAVGLLVSIRVARYLGPEQFGMLSYALAFVALFRVISTLGLEEILTRDLVKMPEKTGEILGSALVLRLSAASLTVLLVSVAVAWMKRDVPLMRDLVIITSFAEIANAAMVFRRWFDAHLEAKYNVVASNAALLAVAALKLYLVFVHAPIMSFVWANTLQVVVNAILVISFFARRHYGTVIITASKRMAATLIGDSWPRIPAGIALAVRDQLGAVLIGDMIGAADLGQYSMATRFYGLVAFIPGIVCSSLAPSLTVAKQAGEREYMAKLSRMYRVLIVSFLAILPGVLFMSFWGIRWLCGVEYAQAGHLLFLMTFRMLLLFLGQGRMWFSVNDNLFRYGMRVTFILLPVDIILNYFMIRFWGVVGGIAAATLSYFLLMFVIDAIFKEGRPNLHAILIAGKSCWPNKYLKRQ